MTGPIAGLRVVDLSAGHAGPRATSLLADYGADVVWIEPPGGDPLREREPWAVSVFGRSKRSVVADLADDTDRRRIAELIDRADVLVTAWSGDGPPDGLDPDTVRRRNPALVYCSISDVGPEPPDGWRATGAGHEAVVQAVLGGCDEGQSLSHGPIYQGFPFASVGASYLAVIGTLAALYRRSDDGAGRDVETSLLDGALAYLSMMWGESDQSAVRGNQFDRKQMTSRMRLITRSFECADGEYVGVHTGAVGAFGRLMKLLGLDDRVPASETGMDIGVPLTDEQFEIVFHEVPKIFAERPRHEWVDELMAADVCAVEHLRPTMVFDSPQALANGMVVTVDDPVLGEVEQVAPAARFSLTAPAPPRPAPLVGEQTEALADHLGWAPRAEPGRSAGPGRELLAGLKILDLGAYYAGPYSSRLLADLGADVIKLEPTLGDQLRGIERPFYSAQANKRSIAANLKDPRLGKLVEGLVAWADVIHHNLRPGAAERLGLDDASVRAINPDIVYLYAPGWGSSGPFRLRQSFAPMMSGYVGVSYEIAGEYNPPLPAVANEDPGNGLLGAAAILMALLHRRQHGSGQYVENPQLNATMAHLAHIVRRDGEPLGAGRLDSLQLGIGPFERLYATSDGWVMVEAVSDAERAALAAALGVDLDGAHSDDDRVGDLIGAALATLATDAAVDRLVSAGVPAACPVTEGNHAFMNDIRQRGIRRVAELPHPVKGNVRELATLVRVSDAAPTDHRLAPELGEHTDEIMTWVGYTSDEIQVLRADGVVR